MRNQLVHADSGVRLQHHASHHELSPLGVGYPEDRRLMHGRMLVDDGFALPGIHILTPRDNHLRRPIENVNKALGSLITDVASAKHSYPKRKLGLIRAVP